MEESTFQLILELHGNLPLPPIRNGILLPHQRMEPNWQQRVFTFTRRQTREQPSMSNYINMVIPTNSVPLSQVTYSIAIDNDYALYLNNSNAPIQTFKHENYAIWVPYQSFDDVAPGLLHYGTNSLRVVITDEGDINYFSMIVSTNACGQ